LQDLAPERQWTAEEIALVESVSEQLALTVENLRLFDDTQKRAGREQITREITDKMRAAPDMDTIIQTGLRELAKALGASRTYIKLNPDMEQD
jgi:GAF domain-containing protein